MGAQDQDQRRTKKNEEKLKNKKQRQGLACRKSRSAVVKWKVKPSGIGPDLVSHEKIKTQNKMILDLENPNQTRGK
jgi:hypothetical protein